MKLASAGTNDIGKAAQTQVKSPPCNLYIGNNFCVRIYDFFDLQNSIQNNKKGGLVHIDFDPAVHFKAMTLSVGAEKIWSVPNAGGNSVISEVLSFETFHRCFHAELLRVRRVPIEAVCTYMYIFKVLIFYCYLFVLFFLFCFNLVSSKSTYTIN